MRALQAGYEQDEAEEPYGEAEDEKYLAEGDGVVGQLHLDVALAQWRRALG